MSNDVDLDSLIHEAIEQERTRQETELGYTAAHDDKHGVDHLAAWASTYRKQGKYIKALALLKAYDEAWDRQVERVRAENKKQIDRAMSRRRDH